MYSRIYEAGREHNTAEGIAAVEMVLYVYIVEISMRVYIHFYFQRNDAHFSGEMISIRRAGAF